MKPIKTSCALILGILTFFSISNANAAGCSSHTEKKAEIECLSDDKKFMGEAKRREELGLPPREKKKEKQTSKNQLNLSLIHI